VRVAVRLFATLVRYQGGVASGEPFELDLANDATVADAIDALGIPHEEVHLTLVDGRIVHTLARRLADGARVGLFPPVGGG